MYVAKIILVDDEILIRKGIKSVLEQEDNFDVTHDFSDGSELLLHLNNSTNIPDVILMDIKMPNLNGVETTKIIIEQYPDIKVVMLSSFYTDIFIAKMFEIGAVCYLSKNANPIEIISAINRVLENGFFYNDFEMNFLANKTPKNKDNNNIDDLSKRELEVLHYICKQFSSSEIAQKIDISPRTVDGHRNKLLEKTKTKNVVGLVVYAIQHNLFSPEIDF